MSGGHFNYDQFKLGHIADSIEFAAMQHEQDFPPEVLTRLRETAVYLQLACGLANCVDYLLSDDHGPDSFVENWNDEKAKILARYNDVFAASEPKPERIQLYRIQGQWLVASPGAPLKELSAYGKPAHHMHEVDALNLLRIQHPQVHVERGDDATLRGQSHGQLLLRLYPS